MSRDDCIQKAKWAEQAERYDDMAKFMKNVVSDFDTVLEIDERNLLSVAYKNVVGARRSSWRVISSIVSKLENSDGDKAEERHLQQAKTTQAKIEEELINTCNEVINLLSDKLIPITKDKPEGSVFYLKMKGDYYRYIAEVMKGDDRKSVVEKAEEAYNNASDMGKNEMPPTHPIRLGLALNFSVFYYEIMNDQGKACSLAKQAFEDGMKELDSLKDSTYKDSTLIMQLLRDNLTLWTDSENQPDEQQECDE